MGGITSAKCDFCLVENEVDSRGGSYFPGRHPTRARFSTLDLRVGLLDSKLMNRAVRSEADNANLDSRRRPSSRSYGAVVAAAAFYILIVILTTAWIYHQASDSALAAVDQHLLAGTAGIPYVMSRHFHDHATGPGAISKEEDDRNIRRLSDVARHGGYAFLFTLIYRDGQVYVTASSATEEELAAGSEVRYFQPYEEADAKVVQALTTTQQVLVSYADRWGSFRGAYVPKSSPSGQPYVACAEVEISEVQALLRRKLAEALAAALLLSLATVPIFLLVIRRERRHAQVLGETNARLNREMNERKAVEARLIQAHKMEALGTLAGGVAHDFNNILASIHGFTELALENVDAASTVAGDLSEIKRAAQRAKELVQQIQAFARPDSGSARSVRVKTIAQEVLTQIQAGRPSAVQVEARLESEALVRTDPTSMHQVLMNLCTNAVQAMTSQGGVLTLSLKDVEPAVTSPDVRRLQITVSDTGVGMTPEIIGSIFEPYFTTKGAGRGTGLGLAVVHGLVQSMGGQIQVQSEVGRGSVFTLLLPVVEGVEMDHPSAAADDAVPRGHERVLVVDDESAVGRATARNLTQLGYQVTVCTHSEQVLGLVSGPPLAFELVITDLIMPGLSGDQLMAELAEAHPELPVLLCTGYAERLEASVRERLLARHQLLRKPFTRAELARVVRNILDQRPAA